MSALLVNGMRFLHNRLNIRRGLGRMTMLLARGFKGLHELPVRVADGRTLYLDLREAMCLRYFLEGEDPYERGETRFVHAAVRAGDVVLDIGANVGWYTTLLAGLVGPRGRVYAFEPNKNAVRLLRASAAAYENIRIVDVALGEAAGDAVLHIPEQGVTASLRDLPGTRATQRCPVTTLDKFLAAERPGPVTFVKCDVEGAELPALRGAARSLAEERPPLWMIEMNPTTARRFGYEIGDIVAFFAQFAKGRYGAYRIDECTGALAPLLPPYDKGENKYDVAFVPAWLRERCVTS
jgi:FkbM family methyltransferase